MSNRRIPPSQGNQNNVPAKPWLEAEAGRALAIGVVLSLIILASPLLTFLLSPLVTIVHEFGHATTAWLFGYPAIPSFDFIFGGGVTRRATERFTPILFVLYSALGYGMYYFRAQVRLSQILLGFTVGYTFFAFTGLHQTLIVGMGHGFELIFAGIFLYRALSGEACRIAAERPLYGMLACYIFLYDLKFARGLLLDQEIRQRYLQGKGGVLDNDFVRLAHGASGLSGVVMWFILACIVTPPLVFWIYKLRQKDNGAKALRS